MAEGVAGAGGDETDSKEREERFARDRAHAAHHRLLHRRLRHRPRHRVALGLKLA
jgi:hypothetical protein